MNEELEKLEDQLFKLCIEASRLNHMPTELAEKLEDVKRKIELVKQINDKDSNPIIRNFTPHSLHFYHLQENSVWSTITIPSEGIIRAKQEEFELEYKIPQRTSFPIPVMKRTAYGEPDNLPEPQDCHIFVVSQIAAQAIKTHHPERKDFYIVAETIRNEDGGIIGCKSLTQI